MVRVSSKHLGFVVLVFLCFITIVDGARSFRSVPSPVPPGIRAEKGQNHVLAPLTAEEENEVKQNGEDDLVTVDYTPARRKPPIHN